MRTRRLIIIIVLAIALSAAVCIGGGELAANLVERTRAPQPTPVAPQAAARLRAQGVVAPARWVELGYPGGGLLAEVPAAAGQAVQAGEVLARLDTKALARRMASAEADLALARTRLESLLTGPSEVELLAAQVELARAEADVQRLTAGPVASELAAAQAAVQDAEREVELARQNLTVVQKSDVVSKNVRDREYEHNWFEANYGEYKAKFERGEIDQTRLDLEWNALLTAKERLDSARAEADLALGQAEDRLAQAESNLRAARDRLADLQPEPDAAEVAVAQLAVEKAQAQWDQLQARAAGMDLDGAAVDASYAAERKQAETAVAAAQADLEAARADLEAAALTAPFAGTVVAVEAVPGELVGSGPFITLADLSSWQVETVDADEWLVARIELGQPVELTFPAFEDKVLTGTVASVAPRPGQATGSEAFYTVVVTLGGPDDQLRWGMTARLDFGEER